MNTKSFVNQLDADNVVKGYYDESDQLVMVEPEGAGGGGDSDFTIVTMTVVGAPSGLAPRLDAINISEEYGMSTGLIPNPGTYDIVLYNGTQRIDIGSDYVVTGSANLEEGFEVTYIVTGDFTITYNGGGE